MVRIIYDVCRIGPLPNLHGLVYGNDTNDIAGALICAPSFHLYDSLKIGTRSNVMKAIDYSTFSSICASAHSIAKAFKNELDIQSMGGILKCGTTTRSVNEFKPGLWSVRTLSNNTGPAASNFLYAGFLAPLTNFAGSHVAQQK